MRELSLGINKDVFLEDPLDLWTPLAVGSSARVFRGFLRNDRHVRQAALKILRPDKVEYALPLFKEEIRILNKLADVDGITKMLDYGFLRLPGNQQLPEEKAGADARHLTGDVLRVESQEDFSLDDMDKLIQDEWIPYISLRLKHHDDNLMKLCTPFWSSSHQYLPIELGIRISAQICRILEVAHSRNILYLDHKILHYYWSDILNRVQVIDWNVAQQRPQLSEAEKQFDIVQLGSRTLHYIFTARPAVGSLGLGPTRPDEIRHAPRIYEPRWERDDDRVPDSLKQIIDAVLHGAYHDAGQLAAELEHLPLIQLPDV